MLDLEKKRKIFHQDIRRIYLNQYFQKIRTEKIKKFKENEEIQIKDILLFLNQFPKNVEKLSPNQISEVFLERLIEPPHNWLNNCHRKLDMCQWVGLIQLMIAIFQRCKDNNSRQYLLLSAKKLICQDFKKRLSENKIMRRQILTLTLDFNLEIREEITMIEEQYLQTLKILLNQLLPLNFQEYENQFIKGFAICNHLLHTPSEKTSEMMEQMFIRQKWIIFKMVTFIERFSSIYQSQTINVLLQMMLIFLINLTEHTQNSKFYGIFLRKQFLSVINNILTYPNDCLPSLFKFYLKLIFNLIIESHQFAIFINKTINFNQLHAKIRTFQEQILVKDMQAALFQYSHEENND